MNTSRILMIAGATFMITGFAITVICTRILHVVSYTPLYAAMGLAVVGLIMWVIARARE